MQQSTVARTPASNRIVVPIFQALEAILALLEVFPVLHFLETRVSPRASISLSIEIIDCFQSSRKDFNSLARAVSSFKRMDWNWLISSLSNMVSFRRVICCHRSSTTSIMSIMLWVVYVRLSVLFDDAFVDSVWLGTTGSGNGTDEESFWLLLLPPQFRQI